MVRHSQRALEADADASALQLMDKLVAEPS